MEPTTLTKERIHPTKGESIDENAIDSDALNVVDTLQKAGYTAYIVGGCVRDLLLHQKPKDFDISTNAMPHEIKKLFKRSCLLIGRRFRLAHLRFGKKVIEVSTFRSGGNEGELIIRDNEWGTEKEDVLRRDFTINGLLYDPSTKEIIDYVGGVNDIRKKLLTTIGDPITRFRQDPVRMIRLIKFQARLGFTIEPKTLHALKKCGDEIIKSAPARLLEEVLRMLESGSSSPFFRLMVEHELLEHLFPAFDRFLRDKHGEEIFKYLTAADALTKESEAGYLDRACLVACLFFPILEQELDIQYIQHDTIPHTGEIQDLAVALIDGVESTSFFQFPKKLRASLIFILSTQFRLIPMKGQQKLRTRFMGHEEFASALRFLEIRALADETIKPHYEEWQKAYESQAPSSTEERRPPSHRRRRGRRPA